jgi:hypothetical protein
MATVIMDALSHQAIRAAGAEAKYYNAAPERTGKWKDKRLTGLEQTLADLGHRLEIAPPDASILAGAPVLIIASRSQVLMFSPAELAAIRDFVTSGGGLLLMANHQRFIMPQQQVVLALELPFGFIDTTLDGFPQIVLSPHVLTAGCESIVVRNSTSIAAPAGATPIAHFALDPRHRFAVTAEIGKGRVIATGDSGFIASNDDTGRDMFALGSNAIFFANCIRWLARTT